MCATISHNTKLQEVSTWSSTVEAKPCLNFPVTDVLWKSAEPSKVQILSSLRRPLKPIPRQRHCATSFAIQPNSPNSRTANNRFEMSINVGSFLFDQICHAGAELLGGAVSSTVRYPFPESKVCRNKDFGHFCICKKSMFVWLWSQNAFVPNWSNVAVLTVALFGNPLFGWILEFCSLHFSVLWNRIKGQNQPKQVLLDMFGLHSTEEAFLLPTQQPWVWLPALPRFFIFTT